MSEPTKTRLQVASFAVMLLITAGGWLWIFAGDRQVALATFEQHENRLRVLEADQRRDSNDLATIRADVRWIRSILEKQHR